jgi:hypothetical protein
VSPADVEREVDRILAARESIRREASEQRDKYVIRILKRRLEEFTTGRRIGMCFCRNCLAGYVTLDVSSLCINGRNQFNQDASWRPHGSGE